MTMDDNRWHSISINQLILIINGLLIAQVFVIIDCHRLSMSLIIDQLNNINFC